MKRQSSFLVPELFKSIRDYTFSQFLQDLSAGIIVGIVALPLAIAFGIASGVSPTEGLITAIIGGFIVSLFGGSKVQIGGPTGAFIVIVYAVIQKEGLDGLMVATLMAGFILLLMGGLRLGTIIRFIPYPIIVGFTAGIAVTIFTTQVKDILGLSIESLPGDFIGKWSAYIDHISTLNFTTLIFAILSVLIINFTPRVFKKVPGSLVALLSLTILAYLLNRYNVITTPETIGDHFSFSSSMPQFRVPEITITRIHELLPTAFTIAMLGAIESLLSASVADGVIGAKHDSNCELLGQGIANIVVPFLGGIPVTGAIARTMTNINNGGRTPVAGIIHAVVLLLILLFLGPITAYIPLAVLAGVLVIVSYNMSGWRSFISICKGDRSDAIVLIVTFLLTVLIDLTVAIEFGMLLAVLLFMRRLTKASQINKYINKVNPMEGGESHVNEELDIPEGVEVYEIAGPFFFGIANRFDEAMRSIGNHPIVRIIRLRRVPFIDATAVNNLKSIIEFHNRSGIAIVLSGVRPEVLAMIKRYHIDNIIDPQNICSDIFLAMERSNQLLTNK